MATDQDIRISDTMTTLRGPFSGAAQGPTAQAPDLCGSFGMAASTPVEQMGPKMQAQLNPAIDPSEPITAPPDPDNHQFMHDINNVSLMRQTSAGGSFGELFGASTKVLNQACQEIGVQVEGPQPAPEPEIQESPPMSMEGETIPPNTQWTRAQLASANNMTPNGMG